MGKTIEERPVWDEMKRTAREQGKPVFVVSSVMAMSAVAHLPANVVWLSRAGRSAAILAGNDRNSHNQGFQD